MKHMLLAFLAAAALSMPSDVHAEDSMAVNRPAQPKVKDPVVIVMGKKYVKLSEIMPILASLVGGNLNNLSKEDLLRAIYLAKQMYVMQEVLAQEAIKKNYENSPKYKENFEKAKRREATSIYIKDIETSFKDDELKKLYPEFVAKLPKMKEFSFRLIIVKNSEDAKVITTALAAGSNFGKLAAEKSLHGSADRSGENSGFIPFTREDIITRAFGPAFTAKLRSLGKGAVATINLPNGQVAVVKFEGSHDAKAPAMNEVMPQLRVMAANTKLLKIVENKMKSGEIGFYNIEGKKEEVSFDPKSKSAPVKKA